MSTRRIAFAVRGRWWSQRLSRDDSGQTAPRAHVFADLFAILYDESILDEAPQHGPWQALPGWLRLAAEVRRRSDEYDAIVTCWSERFSIGLMALDHLSRQGPVAKGGKPHIALMYWFSRPSRRIPLRAFADSLHAIITWSSVQRAYAIEHLGISPAKLHLVRHFVDQRFWTPRDCGTEIICSAGAEMRDYPTLIEAMRETDIPCHIATDHFRVDRFGFMRRLSVERFAAMASPNVTIGWKTPLELREVYSRSRFVVVPLRPTDTDNGVNVILEAMAMGKPVICSRTRGQVDVVQEGVTGLFVPGGDPAALRRAICELWSDPERARTMGRAARAYVEKHHALERFCQDVKNAIDASLDGRSAAADGSVSAPYNRVRRASSFDQTLACR